MAKTQKSNPTDDQVCFLAEYKKFVSIWNNTAFQNGKEVAKALGFDDFRAVIVELRRLNSIFDQDPFLAGIDRVELLERKPSNGKIQHINEAEVVEMRAYAINRTRLMQAKGVIVTSAQFGGDPNHPSWEALVRYAHFMGYEIVVLPIKYGPVKVVNGRLVGKFDPVFKGYVLFDDLWIAPELLLSTARFRPTLQTFLTDSVCAMGGNESRVYPAPVYELQCRPRVGNLAGDQNPRLIMTTGSVTLPDYRRDNLGQQDRTGVIATENHETGALVIEFLPDRNHFFPRPLLFGEKKVVYDICPQLGGAWKITSKGVKHVADAVSTVVHGDWHIGMTDPVKRNMTVRDPRGLLQVLRPIHVIVQDFVDGFSVEPFSRNNKRDAGDATLRALYHTRRWDCLQTELDSAVEEVRYFLLAYPELNLVVIPANHPDFVTRYVGTLQWTREERNMEIGAELFLLMIRELKKRRKTLRDIAECDVVAEYILSRLTKEERKRVYFPTRKEAVFFPRRRGIKQKDRFYLAHGDIGANGGRTRGSREFIKLNVRTVLGHNHSASKWRSVWRVGTSTNLAQPYIRMFTTAWSQTDVVIFQTAQPMHIHFIKGRWHGQSDELPPGYKKKKKQ